MDTLNNGCALCKEKYTERQFSGDGHCLIISLNCVNGHSHTWMNSVQHHDGEYKINKEIYACWETVGGNPKWSSQKLLELALFWNQKSRCLTGHLKV